MEFDLKTPPRTPSEFAYLKKLCIETILKTYELGNSKFGLKIPAPKILFSLSGKTAGLANTGENWIKLNEHFLFHNPKMFLDRTAIHEVAHIFAFHRYRNIKIESHGLHWTDTGAQIGLKDLSRCHKYDLTDLPKYRHLKQAKKPNLPVQPFKNGKIIDFND